MAIARGEALAHPAEQKHSPNNIVIVGGGPVGLVQALGLKKLNKDLNVTVLEKYDAYQRKHTLIMQPASLDAVMKATNTQDDPDLSKLLARLQKDPHIRTNELESIFKDLAKKSGVDIVREEVKSDTIKEQLSKYKPDFIIGADGTHSVVNQKLFSNDNQVKVEFDYVLQCRYEVKSAKQAEQLSNTRFYENMSRHGIIANEYVGHHDEKTGSTPVTMQMMISKEAFQKLRKATSKRPIAPFQHEKQAAPDNDLVKEKQSEEKELSDLAFKDIPHAEQAFLRAYFALRIRSSRENNNLLDEKTARISVNEAPATYAKQPTTSVSLDEKSPETVTPVMLAGDAMLGLSYFKGLNAGLLSTAKFFSTFAPFIRNSQMRHSAALNTAFAEYTEWFLNDFAPKKVSEVESYSTWNIRALMTIMRVVRSIKYASMAEEDDAEESTINDYFRLMAADPAMRAEFRSDRGLYPHRKHDLIKLAQFDYIPITYTLKKIAKLFVDYVKPYKSNAQLIQDFKQPLVGIANIVSGVAKLITGFFNRDTKRFGDGLFSTIRGAIEIATFPLAWILKPIARGLITLATGKPKIENNPGIRRVAQQGLSQLAELKAADLSDPLKKFKLLAISDDLHRKFKKSQDRGQESKLALDEQQAFNTIRTNIDAVEPAQFMRHFSLFAPAKQTPTAKAQPSIEPRP